MVKTYTEQIPYIEIISYYHLEVDVQIT